MRDTGKNLNSYLGKHAQGYQTSFYRTDPTPWNKLQTDDELESIYIVKSILVYACVAAAVILMVIVRLP
jgi:hypothetical protein